MSSFRRYCEVARDEREPVGKRYKSLRYAAERYSWLTRTSFESIFADLANRCALKVGSRNDSHALTAAAAELERARRLFLDNLGAFIIRRRFEKRDGKRFPTFGSAKALHATVSLGRPLPEPAGSTIAAEIVLAVERVATVPEFALGDFVQVVINARNRTARHGQIVRRTWHFKHRRWMYFIRQQARRISKRYFADDLIPWSGAG